MTDAERIERLRQALWLIHDTTRIALEDSRLPYTGVSTSPTESDTRAHPPAQQLAT